MKNTETAVRDAGNAPRVLPESFRIARKALVHARNVTTNEAIFHELGEILTQLHKLETYIGA